MITRTSLLALIAPTLPSQRATRTDVGIDFVAFCLHHPLFLLTVVAGCGLAWLEPAPPEKHGATYLGPTRGVHTGIACAVTGFALVAWASEAFSWSERLAARIAGIPWENGGNPPVQQALVVVVLAALVAASWSLLIGRADQPARGAYRASMVLTCAALLGAFAMSFCE
jgi:hypothetical protein